MRVVMSVRMRYSSLLNAEAVDAPHDISSDTRLISSHNIPIFDCAVMAIASVSEIPASFMLASLFKNSGIMSSICLTRLAFSS